MVRSTLPPSQLSRFNNHITAPVPRISDKPRPLSHRINLKWAKMSRVYDHLYLGGAIALNSRVIYDNQITFIINATTEAPSVFLHGVESMKLWVADTAETDLTPHFDSVADIIHTVHQNGGRTLVHCLAGVSRSASLVLAYLMKYKRMSLREAYHFLAALRPVVRPSLTFWRQLIDFEMRVRKVERPSVRFVAVPGTEGQSLPDVYMVTLEEEDEEQEENESENESDVDMTGEETSPGPSDETSPPPQTRNLTTGEGGYPLSGGPAPISTATRYINNSATPINKRVSSTSVDSEEDFAARDSGLETECEDTGSAAGDAGSTPPSLSATLLLKPYRNRRRHHNSDATFDSIDGSEGSGVDA